MTIHTAVYESVSAREQSSPGGRNDAGFRDHQSAAWITENVLLRLEFPVIPPTASGSIPVDVMHLRPLAADSMGYLMCNETVGVLDGTTLDNVVVPFEREITTSGRMGGRINVRFGGAYTTALIALGDVASVKTITQYRYRDTSYLGLTHFVDFESHPDDSNADGSIRMKEILNAANASGARTLLGSDGTNNLYANYCGLTGVSPECIVYIAPEDYGGANPDQIPTAVGNNNPAAYRAHPSVFYPSGRAQYIRALTRGTVDEEHVSKAAAGMPIGVKTIDSQLTGSDWLIMVDGQNQLVRLSHPEGSDYRRPRDIWNNVWVPILRGSGSPSAASVFGSTSGANGGGVGYRWAYADYFRCLPLAGTYQIQDDSGLS